MNDQRRTLSVVPADSASHPQLSRRSRERRCFQLKVTLEDVRPVVWRRIVVGSDTTLPKLHRILQIVMGWEDYHLHAFDLAGVQYGVPDPEYPDETINEQRVRLDELLSRPKDRMRYWYDFGDDWWHTLVVEEVRLVEGTAPRAVCLDGARACPPEDVGGVEGYREYRHALRNPRHPEHESWVEWRGPDFDPEAFDLATVNARLAKLR